MKKIILSIASMLVTASLSTAQIVSTATSVTYTGNTVAGFYAYQDQTGSTFTDNACSVPFAETLGGFDGTQYDATTVVPARAAGVIFYGGGIANLYYGTPCVDHKPSFGLNTTAVDLTLAANQKITFNYQSDLAINLELQLKDVAYTGMLSSVPFSLLGDGVNHSVSLDFSSNVTGDLSAIRQVSFVYPGTTISGNFGISISNLKLGSTVTGVTDAEGVFASANLFPNPSTGLTTITAELPSSADVKVSLMDMYGREVKVITEGNMNTINASFDVSSLSKGVYMVNYQVSGKATKVQKLVVR